MNTNRNILLFLVGTIVLFANNSVSETRPPEMFGTWRNPKGTVHVEIQPCGAAACGTVVWASANAKDAVRKSIGQELIGLQIFRDMVPTGAGGWRGKVFVPDLNLVFTGFARAIDSKELHAKGCLIGKVFCKSQTWTRVSPSVASSNSAS